MSKLFINEVYPCVQGEGARLGWPSVLIRTSGCSLRCKWCDSSYTSWKPEGETLELKEILDAVDVHAILPKGKKVRDIILSGGEPLMQDTIPLLQELCHRGYSTTIETSGSVLHTSFVRHEGANPGWFKAAALHDQISISCSPKLRSSTPGEDTPREKASHEKLRVNREVLEWLQGIFGHNMYFKFVITDPIADMKELQEEWIETGILQPHIPIYLMAQGRTEEELKQNGKAVLELAREHNFRFSPRLHIDIYGNVRKV